MCSTIYCYVLGYVYARNVTKLAFFSLRVSMTNLNNRARKAAAVSDLDGPDGPDPSIKASQSDYSDNNGRVGKTMSALDSWYSPE